MVIQGHIQDGVIVPDNTLSLPDGTHVTIVIPSASPPIGKTMTEEQRVRYLEALTKIDAVPNENPGDSKNRPRINADWTDFRGSDSYRR